MGLVFSWCCTSRCQGAWSRQRAVRRRRVPRNHRTRMAPRQRSHQGIINPILTSYMPHAHVYRFHVYQFPLVYRPHAHPLGRLPLPFSLSNLFLFVFGSPSLAPCICICCRVGVSVYRMCFCIIDSLFIMFDFVLGGVVG
jgi:hypothetical protein